MLRRGIATNESIAEAFNDLGNPISYGATPETWAEALSEIKGEEVTFKATDETFSEIINSEGPTPITTFTVTYDVNGGTGSIDPVEVEEGQSITLNDGSGIVAPTDKEFDGWSTTKDDAATKVSSPYAPVADVTLFALYKAVVPPVTTFTVTYDVNGGEGSIDPVEVEEGQSITLDDGSGITAPADKEFDGWTTTKDDESTKVSSPFTPDASVTLFALYKEVPATIFTITYDLNGGTAADPEDFAPVEVTEGDAVALADGSTITFDEGTFGGWTTTKDDELTLVTSPYAPAADITLYALIEE